MRGNKRYLTRKEKNITPDDDISMWQIVVSGVMIVGGLVYTIIKLRG